MSLTSTPTPAVSRTGLLHISLAGVLWGTGGLTVQLVRDITPMSATTLSTYRMGIAAVILGVVVLAVRRGGQLRRLLTLDRAHTWALGCGTAAYQGLYFAAVVAAGVSVATVVALGLAPVLLTVSDALGERRFVPRARVVVLVAALTGLVLVSGFTGTAGPEPALGVVLACASGATYAATTSLGRPLAQRTDPVVLTAATTLTGTVVMLPVAVLLQPGGAHVTTDPAAWGGLLYLGAFTMALAYVLLYAGLRTTPGRVAVIASLLEPVTAAVTAALVLGEHLGPAGVTGTVLVLAAVAGLGSVDGDGPVARAAPGD